MMNQKYRIFCLKVVSLLMLSGAVAFVFDARSGYAKEQGKPIVISSETESIRERMQREITLDVRDMNIVDIVKFLAMKGEFNVVISPSVEGRATVLLNNVTINDALDIVIISNQLAYKIESNIVSIMTAAEYEALYGKSFSDKTVVEIIRLQYSKPSYVLAALDSIKSNIGKIIIDEDTGSVVLIDTVEAIAAMKTAIIEMEKPLETIIYALQYADADMVADKLRSRIDAKAVGAISFDERSNRVIVRAFPGRIAEIKGIIKELDVPTKEVLVEARILQVVLKPEFDAGIDWQLSLRDVKDDQLKKIQFDNFYLGAQNSAISGSDNVFNQYGQIAVGNFSADTFEMTVRALEQVSDTKILSNPKLLITNNEEARIHVGDTVPYIISTTSGTGETAITSEDVRFVDVGLKLNVRPIINDDGYVTMRLRPEISSVVGTVDSQGGGIPQVNKTEVETTVMVKDGNTIILGGLLKNDKVHIKKGFPYLMDMPVFGKLFGRESDNFAMTEIVLFITPQIVSGHSNFTDMEGTIKPFKSYSTD